MILFHKSVASCVKLASRIDDAMLCDEPVSGILWEWESGRTTGNGGRNETDKEWYYL